MSKSNDKEELANAFGRTLDPLAELEPIFENIDADPFNLFVSEVIEPKDPAFSTMKRYERVIRQWRNWMDDQGRHPACPNEQHVIGFIEWRRDVHENSPKTIRKKVSMVNKIYNWWQNEPSLPHDLDYNPIETGRDKVNFGTEDRKDLPPIPLEKLRKKVQGIRHVRDRAIVVLGLKAGMRASEIANLEISEIHLRNSEIQDHYDDIGTSKGLNGRERALYIPPDRAGNKSNRPRVLPLDDEVRKVLREWLLVRPDNGSPNVILSMQRNLPMDHTNINDVWRKHFHPEYAECEDYKAVTSHYGRHRFSSHFKIKKEWPREWVQYMRGDVLGNGTYNSAESLDAYLHTYYEDIEPRYRAEIFKLGL